MNRYYAWLSDRLGFFVQGSRIEYNDLFLSSLCTILLLSVALLEVDISKCEKYYGLCFIVVNWSNNPQSDRTTVHVFAWKRNVPATVTRGEWRQGYKKKRANVSWKNELEVEIAVLQRYVSSTKRGREGMSGTLHTFSAGSILRFRILR